MYTVVQTFRITSKRLINFLVIKMTLNLVETLYAVLCIAASLLEELLAERLYLSLYY